MAHILADTKDKTLHPLFGKANHYVDDFNPKSPRNFIPLCGTHGEAGTCHNEFDNYQITLLYNPLKLKYVTYCFNPLFKTHLHGKEIEISGMYPPYRRLLAWRSKYCVRKNQHFLNEDLRQEFVSACNFSETSKSVDGGEDIDDGEDSSSS